MYEYIKTGKAILATRGKAGYALTHLENAYLTDDLSRGLRELIGNTGLRNRLAEGARKIKIYTWEEVAKMWLNALNQALEEYYAPDWHNRRREMGTKSFKGYIKSTL